VRTVAVVLALTLACRSSKPPARAPPATMATPFDAGAHHEDGLIDDFRCADNPLAPGCQ
jgi:hypothetical protein